jgi:antitoxin component of MazEF toxin-antitoxin module
MLKTIKTVQEWGNSFGIRLSKDELKEEQIQANDQVEILVRKNVNAAKELFGTLKVKEPTAKIMKEIDREFKSRFN